MDNLRDKPVLVTGGAGYIGSVLVRQLLARGFKVRVADLLRSGGESLIELADNHRFAFFKADIRDTVAMHELMRGCSAVVHLAAIVGDPACRAEPDLARSTNLDGSIQLYEIALIEGCRRFVFASTCSNYGKMSSHDAFVSEDSPLAPVSLYAETKVAVENFLLSRPRSNICKPTCLRFATVYGLSPRIRFDLTVNEFTKELKMGRELVVYGEQFWRPYCHVEDLARSVVAGLEEREDIVAYEVFNVGDTSENYTKKMIVGLITELIPEARIKYVHMSEDPRDYKVNFDKIKRNLGFSITRRVPDGIAQIISLLDSSLLSDPDDRKYYNT